MQNPHGCRAYCLPLLLDEPDVMPQMVHGMNCQLPQRDKPGFAVNGSALPGVGCCTSKNSGHLLPGDLHQPQFFVEVVLLVAEGIGVSESIRTHE